MASLTPTRTVQGDGTTILSLTLTWGPSPGPLLGSYDVQWSTDGGKTFPSGVSVPATQTSYTIAPVLAATAYTARVRAVRQGGGVVSAWVSASASSGPLASAPASPTGLTASGGYQFNTLNWAPVSGATASIYAYHGSGSGATFAQATRIATGVTGSSYVHGGLGASDAWTYWITATNAGGESAPTSAVAATTLAAAGSTVTLAVGGTTIGTRPALNLVAGGNVTLSGADNPTGNRLDVTISASGGGGTGGGGATTLLVSGDTPGPAFMADGSGQAIVVPLQTAGGAAAAATMAAYLGRGPLANRPAKPAIPVNGSALYWSTDTAKGAVWNPSTSSWVDM